MTRKKPTTQEELQQDIENHPERGMMKASDGRLVPVVSFQSRELRANITKESYRIAMEIWGAKGLNPTEGIQDMVNTYISQLGNLQLVERTQRIKAETYKTTPTEVRSKTFGSYKRRAREFRARRSGNVSDQ